MEYAATANVKAGFTRAHEERAQVLRDALAWVFSRRLVLRGHRVSRWA
ncbi:hypothetical protein [Arenibacterium sp. LLYu02]